MGQALLVAVGVSGCLPRAGGSLFSEQSANFFLDSYIDPQKWIPPAGSLKINSLFRIRKVGKPAGFVLNLLLSLKVRIGAPPL